LEKETLKQELKESKNTNNLCFRDQLLSIASSIIKQVGSKQYINSLELPSEENDENEEVSIHHSLPQIKMSAHAKSLITSSAKTVSQKNGINFS
jgi:hypothetical protein